MAFLQFGRDGRDPGLSEEKEEVMDSDDMLSEEKEEVEDDMPSEEKEEVDDDADIPMASLTLQPTRSSAAFSYSSTTVTHKKTTNTRGKLKNHSGKNVKEEHKLPIYAVAWSTDIFSQDEDNEQVTSTETIKRPKKYFRCFASVAGRHATIYEVEIPDPEKEWTPQSRSGKFILKQSYYDPNTDEDLYACAFGGRSHSAPSNPQHKKLRYYNDEQPPPQIPVTNMDLQEEDPCGPEFLCVGGKCFHIKVIDTARRQLWMTLSGHGEEITSLKFSPMDSNMLLSASNDKSCRIWNVRSGTCVAILAGHHGHNDIVMSASWHVLGHKIVTGSHDTLVKIWDAGEGTKIEQAMQESYKVPLQVHKNRLTVEARDHFDPIICQFPIFSTNKVHFHPVDSVEFVGDLVLSKASNVIVLWDPDYRNPDGNPNVTVPPPTRLDALKTMTIKGMDADVMFYRCCTSPDGRFVAVGNMEAEVWLFDIDDFKGRNEKRLDLNQKLKTIVRMTAWCPDGRILLCCCDDGGIWKFDISRS